MMPYNNELASYSPLRRIASSPAVQALLSRARIQDLSVVLDEARCELAVAGISPSNRVPDFILAVDGSHLERPVETGYPGAEISYVTVAAVLIDLRRLREIDTHRPADPREFRKTETTATIDRALPSCNVIISGEAGMRESFRRCLYETFRDTKIDDTGESLLETYEALLDLKPFGDKQACPHVDCMEKCGSFVCGHGEYTCSGPQKRPLFSTDALRIHEGMVDGGSNGAAFGEVMQVLERVWVVHVLRMLERQGWLTTLARLAIMIDGPLAVFGHPAWLAAALRLELGRLDERARAVTGGPGLLLVGIEKSGQFVDHFAQLDTVPTTTGARHIGEGVFNPQTALLLTDAYIKQHIIYSDSPKPYGQDTYFGRKFFYKTASGARVVSTVAAYTDAERDMSSATTAQFPRLTDALALLDATVSSRYENSLMPIVRAHAEAAIPLSLGGHVLQELARRMMPSVVDRRD